MSSADNKICLIMVVALMSTLGALWHWIVCQQRKQKTKSEQMLDRASATTRPSAALQSLQITVLLWMTMTFASLIISKISWEERQEGSGNNAKPSNDNTDLQNGFVSFFFVFAHGLFGASFASQALFYSCHGLFGSKERVLRILDLCVVPLCWVALLLLEAILLFRDTTGSTLSQPPHGVGVVVLVAVLLFASYVGGVFFWNGTERPQADAGNVNGPSPVVVRRSNLIHHALALWCPQRRPSFFGSHHNKHNDTTGGGDTMMDLENPTPSRSSFHNNDTLDESVWYHWDARESLVWLMRNVRKEEDDIRNRNLCSHRNGNNNNDDCVLMIQQCLEPERLTCRQLVSGGLSAVDLRRATGLPLGLALQVQQTIREQLAEAYLIPLSDNLAEHGRSNRHRGLPPQDSDVLCSDQTTIGRNTAADDNNAKAHLMQMNQKLMQERFGLELPEIATTATATTTTAEPQFKTSRPKESSLWPDLPPEFLANMPPHISEIVARKPELVARILEQQTQKRQAAHGLQPPPPNTDRKPPPFIVPAEPAIPEEEEATDMYNNETNKDDEYDDDEEEEPSDGETTQLLLRHRRRTGSRRTSSIQEPQDHSAPDPLSWFSYENYKSTV